MTDSPAQAPASLRGRLQGLMVFRVALVTLFLGGTIALDAETLASLSDPRNLALLVLIVATYVLTIVYALALRRTDDLARLARIQIAVDFALTAVLVGLTGGLESVFLFVFYLNVINAAVIAGRTAALAAAGAVTAILLALGALALYEISTFVVEFSRPAPSEPPLLFEVVVDSGAAVLIALLSGRLSERLGETTVQLERKRTDLRRLRRLTQNILASLDSGVVTVDDSGTIIYSNDAAERIAGLDRASLQDRPVSEIFPEIDERLDGEERPSSKTLGDHRRPDPRFEFEYERPDGEQIFIGYSVSVLRDSEGRPAGHVVVYQDLTAVKRLEAEKEQSQRLAAIGELAASIAHEVRNPLASISGSVEMLESVADLEEDARELMEIIVEEVDRLDRLISEFLEYSRPSELSPEPLDLRELVGDVVDLFERRDATRRLDVEFAPDPTVEDWTLEADRESIRQVLWNLLNNAADAVSRGDSPAREGPDIRMSLSDGRAQGKHFYEVAVEDAGPGVPEEAAGRLFEPFFTTREDGSGLGLAISHRLIDKHGGRLQLGEDCALGGAKFVVRLLDETRDPRLMPGVSGGLADDESAPSLAAAEHSSPALDSEE